MAKSIQIGVIAPSSAVPKIELGLGVARMREAGFSVDVHSHVKKVHRFFAGTDPERAEAFYQFAVDPKINVLWCARGGYGAVRVLALLDRIVAERGAPKTRKLLVGYSDATGLLEYVRTRWGWSTLHGEMPGMRKFSGMTKQEWEPVVHWVRGEPVDSPWGKLKLKFFGDKPAAPVSGPLVGGNLTVWASLISTPFAMKQAEGAVVFFEDVDEAFYRVDRVVQQILLSGALRGARAIVLGSFLNCRDSAPLCLKKAPQASQLKRVIENPKPAELQPLRKIAKPARVLEDIFGELGRVLGIPVAYGLPVGHGPEHSAVPMGAQVELSPEGVLRVLDWDWLS